MNETESSAPLPPLAPAPVAPLAYTRDAVSFDLFAPLMRAIAITFLVWGSFDLLHNLMQLKVALGKPKPTLFENEMDLSVLRDSLAMLSSAFMVAGAWHALHRRSLGRRLLLFSEFAWLGMLLIITWDYLPLWRDWLSATSTPDTPLIDHPIYSLVSSVLQHAASIAATVGFIVVLRLRVVCDYFDVAPPREAL